MIDADLRARFETIIGIKNLDFQLIDELVKTDANILRPIKGVCFESFLVKMIKRAAPQAIIVDGQGDHDVDVFVSGKSIQVKTPITQLLKNPKTVKVALHKTHGDESRPNNLYSISKQSFDLLAVLHPVQGVLMVPWNEIPTHSSWPGHLADPASFALDSEYLNRWELIGLDGLTGQNIDDRTIPKDSELPFLSSVTFLEDFEIIATLCKPEYFRAAVMGLKGNLKEAWFASQLRDEGFETVEPVGPYPKYDVAYLSETKELVKIQTKGTSEGFCDPSELKIGVEVMGTHGKFPKRGYQRNMFDFLSIVVSEHQLPVEYKGTGLHFVIIPVIDLPIHYRVKKGSFFSNLAWDESGFRLTLYPNIKLFGLRDEANKLYFMPDLDSYTQIQGHKTIPENSNFRTSGPYYLDSFDRLV